MTDKEEIKDGSVEEFYESGQLDWRGNYKDGKGEGLFEYYYKNGQLEKRGNVKEGKPDGLFEYYYENGQLQRKGNYKDGNENGLWKWFHENGQLKFKGNYKNGEQDGPWESFDEEGNPIKTEKYKDGILQESDSTIKNIVSNLSKFIDESNKLKKFFPFLKSPPLVYSTRRDELVKDLCLLLKYYDHHIEPLEKCDKDELEYNFCYLVFRLLLKLEWEFNKFDVVITTLLSFSNYDSGLVKSEFSDGYGVLLRDSGVNPNILMNIKSRDTTGDCFKRWNTQTDLIEYIKILKDKNIYDVSNYEPEQHEIFKNQTPFDIFMSD